MLDERKAAILRAVVAEYIATAQPVGSAHVAGAAPIGVSPATVRNEMVQLEHEGYLTHPHTSAGRIPTDKGYRYFVDQLVEPGPLRPSQRHMVREFFAHAHGEIEQMLQDTTRLLTSLTDYAAVVVGAPQEAAVTRAVQLVSLGPRVVLVVVVLANGSVERRPIELDDEIGEEGLAAAGAHLNAHLVGRPFSDLGAVPPAGDAAIDRTVQRAITALSDDRDSVPDPIFVGGASRMAAAFDAVETVRQVLATLEEQYVVVSLLQELLERGVHVSIGTEHGLPPLAECSIIVAPYDREGERAGSIAVLGPTRMDYPHAMAAVAVVSKRLGRWLSSS